MACYSSGCLQAYLDREVTAAKKAEIAEHLASCRLCREKCAVIKENQAFADSSLAGYMQLLGRSNVDTGEAWDRFEGGLTHRQESKRKKTFIGKGVLAMLSRYRAAATAAAIVLALAVSFSFGAVRTAASELLTIFRVEKVRVINVSQADIASLEKAMGEGTGQVEINNFGQLEFNGGMERTTWDQADDTVDFDIKLPDALPGYGEPEVYIDGGGTMNFTLDTVNTNNFLRTLGSEKLLPDELNGRTFTVKIPVLVTAEYRADGNSGITIGQGRSPELIAPGADVAAVRDALLAVPFLPDELRSQLASINDWQHTLIVPNIAGSTQEVRVGGVEGVFISPSEGSETGGCAGLIWQKDGVVYGIGGDLTLAQALDIANMIK